jgi:hypothetical protein
MANQITGECWLKSEIKEVLQAAGHSTPGANCAVHIHKHKPVLNIIFILLYLYGGYCTVQYARV